MQGCYGVEDIFRCGTQLTLPLQLMSKNVQQNFRVTVRIEMAQICLIQLL